MAQDYVFGNTANDKFHTHFGDSNGDGTVSFLDMAAFAAAFRSDDYDASLDFNGDGVINILDVYQFVVRLWR